MDKERLKRNLEYTKKKHENDRLNTFDTDISMLCFDTLNVLDNCIEIPSGATNGDVLKAIFPNMEMQEPYVEMQSGVIETKEHYCRFCCTGSLDWWNAPYRGTEAIV